jgi:hypothetical protein
VLGFELALAWGDVPWTRVTPENVPSIMGGASSGVAFSSTGADWGSLLMADTRDDSKKALIGQKVNDEWPMGESGGFFTS